MIKQSIKTVLVAVLLVCSANVFAQTQKNLIKGTVTDANTKEAVIGGAVQVKNTSRGVVTDLDGNYEIAASEGETLVFSSLSYKSQEVKIGKSNTINIALETDAEGLEEVVFIGYGTAKKRDLTGAVSTIKAENLEATIPKSTAEMLRGGTAGVNVGTSADADGEASLLIRGESSLSASSSPLIVVDGVIYSGSLTDINPYDIESIDILKDASSAAIYGSQAANGVIAIFTKKAAKSDKPTVDFNLNVGVASPSHMAEVLDGPGFIQFRQDYMTGKATDEFLTTYADYYTDPNKLTKVDKLTWYNYDQKTPVTTLPDDETLTRQWLSHLSFSDNEMDNYIAGKTTDWYKEMFHNGLQQDYTVAVSNKKGESSYYWSLGYADRDGILRGDHYNNYRTRLNLETTIAKFLTVGLNANFAVRNEGYVYTDTEHWQKFSPYVSNFVGDSSVDAATQKWPTNDQNNTNDLYALQYEDKRDMYYDLTSNLYAKVKLPFNFEYQVNFTPHLRFRDYMYSLSSEEISAAAYGGEAERSKYTTYNWTLDNILRWSREIGYHNIQFTGLFNAEKNQYWSFTSETTNFSPNDILGYHRMEAGTVPLASSEDTYETGDALMARLFYSYRNKYMVTASVRRDGYSGFGANYKRATFPAVALGWVFTSEDFMSEAANTWFNYGKLRASWGINGNRSIGTYAALSDMSSEAYLYMNSSGTLYNSSKMYVSSMANSSLRWEKQQAWNFGLDFTMFNSILSGTIEGYFGQTTDLLVERALPNITGFSSVNANLGRLDNNGLEITLNANVMKTENINWKVYGTFSMNRRILRSLYGDMVDVYDENGNVIGQKEADDSSNGWFIGQDPDVIWEYEWAGTWKTSEAEEAAVYGMDPGDFKYIDQNGDGVLDDDDKIFQGYTTPRSRWTFGTDINFCKNWTVSASFYSYWGQKGTWNNSANGVSFPDKRSWYNLPRWTVDNQIDDYAKIGSLNYGSRYVEKSFIRMDNLSIAYSLPKSVCEKIRVQNARVSASIRNVFCWSPMFNYWYDPENGAYYPRTFNIGVHFAL